jgi:hypothetical protein
MTRNLILTVTGAAAAGVTVRAVRARNRPDAPAGPGKAHVLTVNRPLDEVSGNLPEPLAAVDGAVEIRLRAAPGDRGTEIAVRPVDRTVSAGDIRRILRESRSLLEVGEVLRPGGPTTEPTLKNRVLRTATRHGREGGLL